MFTQLKCDSPELLIVAVCGSADRRAVRRSIDGGVHGLVLLAALILDRNGRLGPEIIAVAPNAQVRAA